MAEGAGTIFLVEDVLLVAVREDIDDRDILDLQDRLAEEVVARKVRGVVIDISQLDVVDTFAGRVLGQLGRIAQILNAETYVVGMRPAVAMTLVELGMDLPELRTALNLSQALKRLRSAD